MPRAAELTYQAPTSGPEILERGAVCVIRCPVFDAGVASAPASATITIYDPRGAAVVDGAPATPVSGVASYSYAVPSTLQLGDGWALEFALDLGGETHTIRRAAAVVRRRLYCPISSADLYRVAPALNPAGEDPLSTAANHDDYIEEAWAQLEGRLWAAGTRPYLVVDSSAFRTYMQHASLALVWAALEQAGAPAYGERAALHRELAREEWGRITFPVAAEDGPTYDPTRRASPVSALWLGRRR